MNDTKLGRDVPGSAHVHVGGTNWLAGTIHQVETAQGRLRINNGPYRLLECRIRDFTAAELGAVLVRVLKLRDDCWLTEGERQAIALENIARATEGQ